MIFYAYLYLGFFISGLPFPFLIVFLAVISSVSVFLNIWCIIQICLRYLKYFEFQDFLVSTNRHIHKLSAFDIKTTFIILFFYKFTLNRQNVYLKKSHKVQFVFVFNRKAKKTRLKNGNIEIKSEKETYMELNERDKTCHENQYDSLTYPNNYIDISAL